MACNRNSPTCFVHRIPATISAKGRLQYIHRETAWFCDRVRVKTLSRSLNVSSLILIRIVIAVDRNVWMHIIPSTFKNDYNWLYFRYFPGIYAFVLAKRLTREADDSFTYIFQRLQLYWSRKVLRGIVYEFFEWVVALANYTMNLYMMSPLMAKAVLGSSPRRAWRMAMRHICIRDLIRRRFAESYPTSN